MAANLLKRALLSGGADIAKIDARIAKIGGDITKITQADQVADDRLADIAAQLADKSLDDGSAIEALKREERQINEARTDRAATLRILEDRRRAAVAEKGEAETDRLEAETRELADEILPAMKGAFGDFQRGAKKLADVAPKLAQLAERNRRLQAAGRAPIESGERAARMVPGQTIPAVWAEREVWRMPDGSSPGAYSMNPETGECDIPHGPHAHFAKKVREPYCAREEQTIAPRYAESLADAVFIPGWLPTDPPVWAGKGGRR